MPKVLVSVMQRPPISSAASSTTKRLPAAASRRPAAMPAAPAPTTTASTQERGTSGAPNTGPAASAAPEEARNDRRLKILMGAFGCYVLQNLSWKACCVRVKSSSSFASLCSLDGYSRSGEDSDDQRGSGGHTSPAQPKQRMQAMIDAAAK